MALFRCPRSSMSTGTGTQSKTSTQTSATVGADRRFSGLIRATRTAIPTSIVIEPTQMSTHHWSL